MIIIKTNKNLNQVAKELGEKIRFFRRLKNVSQKELGEVIELTAQQIHKYETGNNDIKFRQVLGIADFLQVDYQEFLPKESNVVDDNFLLQISKLIQGKELTENNKKHIIASIKMALEYA